MTSCPVQTDEDGSTTTYSEMSFPDLGDDSIAYRGTVQDFPVSFALVAAAVDERIVYLIGVGSGSDGELLEGLATIAVARAD
jgi:hypothetical protein